MKFISSLLAGAIVVTSVPAQAQFVFRYKQPFSAVEPQPEPGGPGEVDPGFGIGNDITVYFTGAIGYAFSKVIPVATKDVVEWKRVGGAYQPGLSLDEAQGVISGTASGTTAQRKALLMGYDAAGNAIARANITFSFVNPVGAAQGLVFYGHTGKLLSQEIPATVSVARWEPMTPLPQEFSTRGRFLAGTPAVPYETGVAFVGYDYLGKEVAFTTGDLIIQDGPEIRQIESQHRHPDKIFSAQADVPHRVGKMQYRLVALDGKPSSLGFNPTTGQLRGTIPTFNTALRFRIEAVDVDGTKGASNVFTFSTYAPDVDLSKIADMQGTVGTPFAVRLTGEDLSGEMNWRIASGRLPDGLSLDPESGEISGTPAKEETQSGIVVAVSTSDNGYGETRPFSFRVNPEAISVSFEAADVRVGESFATKGPSLGKGVIAPYSFGLADNSTADPALSVDAAAAKVSGTASAAGSYDVQFDFTNGDGRESVFNQPIQAYNPLSLSYDEVVKVYRRLPANVEPTVATDSIVGQPLFAVEGGRLPDGLQINAETGGIFGTAEKEGATTGVSVRLSDRSGQSTLSNTFSIDVQDRPDVEASTIATSVERYVGNSVKVATAANVFGGVTFELVAGQLPAGLVFTPDGFVEGSTSDPIGTYTGFQVRATDGEGYSALSPTFSLDVVAPSDLAQLRDSDATADWTVGSPFSLPLPRPDNAYGPVSYVLQDLPSGISVVGDRLVGTASEVGVLKFPMTLTDDVGRTLSGTFTLNVLEPMTATLTGASAKVSAFSFRRMAAVSRFDLPRGSETSIAASIENGIKPISYDFQGSLPTGLTYQDGAISGTPLAENQSTSVTLTVRDAAGTTVTLPATLATIGRLAVDLSYDFSKPVFLNSSISLPRKPSVRNAIGAVEYELAAGQLPPGMRIEPKTGYILGIPSADGRFSGIVVKATDSEGAQFSGSYGPFEIGVSRRGAIGLASKTFLTVRADRDFLHRIDVTNATRPLVFSPTPDDGAMPQGTSLGTVDGSFSGKLAAGKYGAGVRVTDDFGRTDTTTLSITSVGPLAISPPATRSFNQYADVNVRPVVSNAVGSTRYELAAGTLPAGLRLDSATGAILGSPTAVGTSNGLVIRAVDSTGDSAQTSAFSIAVTNRLPLTLSTATSYPVIANKSFRFTLPVTNKVGAVSFSLTGSLPPGISFDVVRGAFYGVATNIGSFPVTVTVTDAAGGSATKSFTLSVSTNDKPINLTVTAFTTKVGHPISTKAPVYSNHVGDVRFWADETLAQNGLTIDPATGVISGTATELLDFSPNIHITDGSDRVTSRPVRIQVIPNLVVNFPERIQYMVNISSGWDKFSADNVIGTLKWTFDGRLPKGFSFQPSSSGFYHTSAANEMGTFRGVLTATDGIGDVGTAQVEFVVVNNGLPPTISLTPSSGGYAARGTATLTPVLSNVKTGDVVALSPGSAPLPPGMSIVQSASGTWTLSKAAVTEAEVAVYKGVRLRVTDLEGLYSETDDLAFIYASNPRLTYPNVSFSARANEPISLKQSPSGGTPSADVTFEFTSRSLGGQTLTIDPRTGEIGGHVTASGSNTVKMTESYDGVVIRSQSYTVSFTALQLSLSMPDMQGYVGEPLADYVVKVENAGANPRMELTEGPAWLSFDGSSGTFSGVPDAAGKSPFTVVYTDDFGTATLSGFVSVASGDSGYKFLKVIYTDMGQYQYGRLHSVWLYDENGADAVPNAKVVSQKQDWTLALDRDDDTGADMNMRSGKTTDIVLEFPSRTVFSSARSIGRTGGYSGLSSVGQNTTLEIYGSNDGSTFDYLGKGRGTFQLGQ